MNEKYFACALAQEKGSINGNWDELLQELQVIQRQLLSPYIKYNFTEL